MTNDNWGAPAASHWRGGEPVYDRGEAVCVIGAGGSGLTAVKNLKEAGFPVDCYERETAVGGWWSPRLGRTGGLISPHLVTSRTTTQFPDFPMPDDWPDFPTQSQMLTYLERYADHFGLRDHIWFGTRVARVETATGQAGAGSAETALPGHWDVTIAGQQGGPQRIMRYAAVVVASGAAELPVLPEYEGQSEFQGKILHSSACQEPAQLRGKRVLIVGAGNAGCELAVAAAGVANRCWHSNRRGYWYTPKYLKGQPADQVLLRERTRRLPAALRGLRLHRTLRTAIGDQTRFGLPAPDHAYLASQPLVSSFLTYQIGHGGITPVGPIARFGRYEVVLQDGTVLDPDLVVFATGYRPNFDFLPSNLLGGGTQPDPAGLRWNLLPVASPTLALVGLVQPDSHFLACAHWQSVLMARWLRLQDAPDRRADGFWNRYNTADSQRYQAGTMVDSPRHQFAVDHLVYLRALEEAINDLEAAR